MLNVKWNITQKPDPTLKSRNSKQLRNIRMLSASKSNCPRRFEDVDPEFLLKCSTCPSRDLTSGGCFSRMHLVVRSTWYVYVHKSLQEECIFINQFGGCTLRPPRLLLCCFHRRQISSDKTSSPVSSTATKTYTYF